MIFILSPSKSMFKDRRVLPEVSFPVCEKEYRELVKIIKGWSFKVVQKMMKTSDVLTKETMETFVSFPEIISQENSNPAILAYKGDVYQGLKAETLSEADLNFAQQHLRILSGLFGVLKPFDLIPPYRLEMGLPLTTKKYKNIYSFWGDKITSELVRTLGNHKNKILINLASNEYFSSLQIKKFPYPVYHIDFRENKNGKLAGNSITNKKMKGVMANFIIRNRTENPEELKSFSEDGFTFSPAHSGEFHFTFVRK
ncbi:MAG: YaaA family protein [Saprospiraceae bacterium]|nr:YaaA family protein [Saprospiraceae bacterium]MBK8819404.1 YaaA family protein [Saprospiraceae bacterium]MBK9044166.1 YaaA family protein [Saprospiraceae bacterium]